MKKTLFILIIMVMGTYIVSNAQKNSQFHIGFNFPNGRFGDDDKNSSKSGYAAMGFNIGYKHYIPLSTPNLSFVFSLDAFYNDIQSDRKDYWEDRYPSVDFNFSKYINAPAMASLNYTYPLTETLDIYGEGGLGLNCSWMTPDVYESGNTEIKTTYTVAFNLCYGLEAGIVIKDKFTVGLKYNQLGTYKHKYKQVTTNGSSKDTDKGKLNKQPISMLTLTAGIKF